MAQAFGSSINGNMLGSFGDEKLYPTKNLGGFGMEAIIINKELEEKTLLLRNHGQKKNIFMNWDTIHVRLTSGCYIKY